MIGSKWEHYLLNGGPIPSLDLPTIELPIV